MRPKLLDLFCCEGGASEGYRRAGFDVYGIDLFKHLDSKGRRVGFSQDRYPFMSRQLDALEAVRLLLAGRPLRFTNVGHVPGRPMEALDAAAFWSGLRLEDFAAIHASPPCQHASAGTRAMRSQGKSEHPALIEPTRDLLEQTSLPWVIENVSGAALRDPIMLCGSQFGLTTEDEDGFPLRLERHRLFESNVPLAAPGPCAHDESVWAGGVYGGSRGRKPGQNAEEHRHSSRYDRHGGYVPKSIEVQQHLLGIDWMTKGGMAQSLPPAYTEWIGSQLAAHVERVAA